MTWWRWRSVGSIANILTLGPRVAWHIVGAEARESWIDHFCRLFRLLAPAQPATVPLHVLCD